jgi:putative exporter of polyketide antibiotics
LGEGRWGKRTTETREDQWLRILFGLVIFAVLMTIAYLLGLL